MSRYKIYYLNVLRERKTTRADAEKWVLNQINIGLGSREQYKIIDSEDGYPIK